jgi:6-pyruvoyl-tetrahydropterin synthase
MVNITVIITVDMHWVFVVGNKLTKKVIQSFDFLCVVFQWENHAKSLKLEEQTLKKIKDRIHDKVMNNAGTWIDWQYLLDAASLLKKVRWVDRNIQK